MIATAALRGATAGVAALFLSACVPLRPPFNGFSGLAPDDVAIVGRIELVPALVDSDQQVDALSPYKYKNQVYATAGARSRGSRERLICRDPYLRPSGRPSISSCRASRCT